MSESTHGKLNDIPNKITTQQSPLVTSHCDENGTEALINTSYLQPSEKSEDSSDHIENGKGNKWSGIKRRLTIKAAIIGNSSQIDKIMVEEILELQV